MTSYPPKKRLVDRRKYERVRVDYPTTFSGRSSRASATIIDLSICECRARDPYKLNPDDWHGVLIDVPRYEQPIYIARAVVRGEEGELAEGGRLSLTSGGDIAKD